MMKELTHVWYFGNNLQSVIPYRIPNLQSNYTFRVLILGTTLIKLSYKLLKDMWIGGRTNRLTGRHGDSLIPSSFVYGVIKHYIFYVKEYHLRVNRYLKIKFWLGKGKIKLLITVLIWEYFNIIMKYDSFLLFLFFVFHFLWSRIIYVKYISIGMKK